MREFIKLMPSDEFRINDLIVKLDGQDSNKINLLQSIIPFLSENIFNPVIIGINSDAAKRGYDILATNRHKCTIGKRGDNLGGADQLLGYVENTLLPEITSELGPFRSKMIVGCSLRGSFLIYLFTKKNYLFDAYLGISPNNEYDQFQMVDEISKINFAKILCNKFIYYCIANEGESITPDWINGFDRYIENIINSRNNRIYVKVKKITQLNHVSIITFGIIYGLDAFIQYQLNDNILQE